jgi:hypothetical protein
MGYPVSILMERTVRYGRHTLKQHPKNVSTNQLVFQQLKITPKDLQDLPIRTHGQVICWKKDIVERD